MTDKPALTYPVPVLHLPQKGLTVKIGTNDRKEQHWQLSMASRL